MIIRSPRPTSHFTMIRNDVARDHRLSYKARGLLLAMLSYPDNWRFNISTLAGSSPDGRHAITTGLSELVDAGYLQRRRRRNSDGTFATELVVYDVPYKTNTAPPGTPSVGNAVDNETAMTDYPTRVTGQSLEHCETKNVPFSNAVEPLEKTRLCGQCRGTGRFITHDGSVDNCHGCGGDGIRP